MSVDDESDVREIVREEVAAAVAEMEVNDSNTDREAAKPLRRDVLKGLGVLGVGAGIGGGAVTAATQSAEAGSDESGTIGSQNEPVDVEAEDINADVLTSGKIDLGDAVFNPQGDDTVDVEDANGNIIFTIDGGGFKQLFFEGNAINDVSELRFEQTSSSTSTIKTGPGDGTGTLNFSATGQGSVGELKESGNADGNWEFSGNKTRYDNGHILEIGLQEDAYIKAFPIDVRNISSPTDGAVAAHDGSGAIPSGLVEYDGSNWHGVSAVGQGDINWQQHRNPQEVNDFSTTSGTYTQDPRQIDWFLQWDEIVQSGTQGVVKAVAEVDPGTGESVDVRIQNFTDTEQIVEQTGITSSFSRVVLGPVDYTPSTTSSVIRLRFQIKTDPGSNNSTLSRPSVSIGVRR